MGGTDDEVDALVARALSTSLGSQVPQMEPKSKDPEVLMLTTLSSCRMEVENALKQQGQRGLLLEVVVLPMMLKVHTAASTHDASIDASQLSQHYTHISHILPTYIHML